MENDDNNQEQIMNGKNEQTISEHNDNEVKKIKKRVLFNSYWIAIYELISIITYFIIRFGDFSSEQVTDNLGGFLYAILMIFFGPLYWITLLILCIPVFMCFLFCFIAVIDIDSKIKNNDKATSKVAIINLIFEVLYTIIVWGTNVYTVAVGNVILVCVSLVGIVSSLVLLGKVKQYNNFLLSPNIDNSSAKNNL